MKVILYVAVTVNGLIAEEDDSADFLTETESASFVSAVRSAGALIIGRRTYEILSKQPEFQKFVKAGVKMVAVSHSNDLELKDPSHTIAHSPKGALDMLKDHAEVVVAGGAKLNASFMKVNLIDEIYLDVEPTIVGKGIALFAGGDFNVKLKFLGQRMLSDNEIQLHYQVIE